MPRIVQYQYPLEDDPEIAPLISGDGARAYYRIGFLASAQDAARSLLEEGGENRSAMPVLFLYRHYMELALKDVLVAANAFAIELSDRRFGHRLDLLWDEAKVVLRAFGRHEIEHLNDAVAELVELDQRADAFRYATTTSNEPHFERIGSVNLCVLLDTLESVSEDLEGLLAQMEHDEEEMEADIARAVERDRT